MSMIAAVQGVKLNDPGINDAYEASLQANDYDWGFLVTLHMGEQMFGMDLESWRRFLNSVETMAGYVNEFLVEKATSAGVSVEVTPEDLYNAANGGKLVMREDGTWAWTKKIEEL